jgi:hypothetical protein
MPINRSRLVLDIANLLPHPGVFTPDFIPHIHRFIGRMRCKRDYRRNRVLSVITFMEFLLRWKPRTRLHLARRFTPLSPARDLREI